MYQELGQKIKEARAATGKTIAQCATLAGVSENTWWRWEAGRKKPQPDKVLAVLDCQALRSALAAVVTPAPAPKGLAGPAVCPAQALLWMERRSVSALALSQSLKVDHKTVYRWLRGESRPKPFVCQRILAAIPECASPLPNGVELARRFSEARPVGGRFCDRSFKAFLEARNV
jgi:transcriptional regulator with XRE-family HTH domain